MKASVVFFVLAVCFLCVAQSSGKRSKEEHRHFKDWCKKHNKKYKTQQEEEKAMETLMNHKKTVDEHNKLYNEGKKTYKLNLPSHADLTHEEISETMMGIKVPDDEESKRSTRAAFPTYPSGPASVDWSDTNLVGPVRDQGYYCGSCWAFSSAEIVYAVMGRQNRQVQLSPQQLVDCDKTGWTTGCKGGWPAHALEYVKENGIAAEWEYPYKGYDSYCAYNQAQSVAVVSEIYNIPTRGNETLLRDIVAAIGPVSIILCIENDFQLYGGGFYKPQSCCTSLDHAPLITGYGTDPTHGDYWIVKNSWGTTWGDNGYGYVARNDNNLCNIAYHAVYAL